MGFCLFNNVAVAAEHLIRKRGLSRVAIVDIDVHHGNGTQHIFESRNDVFYASLHERPGSLEFPGTGHATECGIGPGTGFTLNVPLNRGSNESHYLQALRQQVIPALDRFRPQFLLVSAGFDALMWDRVSNVSLEPPAFRSITRELIGVADDSAEGKVVSVLEGGYDMNQLGKAVCEHIRSLLED
jgi:acetoin utilization deacetylase AcuC-like enzyme